MGATKQSHFITPLQLALATALAGLILCTGRHFPYHPQKIFYDLFLAPTVISQEPFTHLMTDVDPLPDVDGAYTYWQFLIPVLVGGPGLFVVYAYIMSKVTGEWEDPTLKSFQRETLMTVKSLFLTSPLLGYYLYLFFSMKVGLLYYDDANYNPFYTYLLSPLLFFIISDTTFYWGHRLWHIPFLYHHSHYYHHTCRPTTGFAGNAADVFEIVFTGYLAAIVPVFIAPIHARIFLILTVFSHIWTIFLHNHAAIRVGFYIYDGHDHNIHHYYGQNNGNFGLYFQFWDRVMGTYRPIVPSVARLGGTGTEKE